MSRTVGHHGGAYCRPMANSDDTVRTNITPLDNAGVAMMSSPIALVPRCSNTGPARTTMTSPPSPLSRSCRWRRRVTRAETAAEVRRPRRVDFGARRQIVGVEDAVIAKHVDAVVWIPDSKTPNGIGEVPLTDVAVQAFRDQLEVAGTGPFLFPSDKGTVGHQLTFKTAWAATLRSAKVPHFRIYDLRSTFATRLSAGGVADEWVTQLLRQGDAKVFKKYSQMQLKMKRETLAKLNRSANESRVRGQAG